MIPKAQPLADGLVVLFEGIDGAGKTTQVDLARQALEAAGWPVLSTRNLGGTPIGEALREAMLSPVERPALTDLYVSLAIQEALLGVIEDARQQGKIILMDRGPLSLAAYQVHQTGIDDAAGWQYVHEGMSRLRPEITLLYIADIKATVERGRRHSGKPDYFENKPLSYFERVAAGYAAAGQRYALESIDAAQTIEAVHAQTIELLAAALRRKLNNQI